MPQVWGRAAVDGKFGVSKGFPIAMEILGDSDFTFPNLFSLVFYKQFRCFSSATPAFFWIVGHCMLLIVDSRPFSFNEKLPTFFVSFDQRLLPGLVFFVS